MIRPFRWRQHLRQGPAHHPESADEVGVEHAGEGLLVHLEQELVVVDPGVGHEHFDRAQLAFDHAHRLVHRCGVGDVAGHAEEVLDLARTRGDRHPVPAGGEAAATARPMPGCRP